MYFLKSTQQKYNKRQSLKEETKKGNKNKTICSTLQLGKKMQMFKSNEIPFFVQINKN